MLREAVGESKEEQDEKSSQRNLGCLSTTRRRRHRASYVLHPKIAVPRNWALALDGTSHDQLQTRSDGVRIVHRWQAAAMARQHVTLHLQKLTARSCSQSICSATLNVVTNGSHLVKSTGFYKFFPPLERGTGDAMHSCGMSFLLRCLSPSRHDLSRPHHPRCRIPKEALAIALLSEKSMRS